MRFLEFQFHRAHRSHKHFHSIAILLLALFSANGSETSYLHVVQSPHAGCSTSSPSSGSYTVTVCFTSPRSGDTVTGNATVTATASTTGPGVLLR